MEGGELLLMLLAHLVLTGLPGAAAALVAAERGVGSVPVLLATSLAASGVAAMAAFWLYYADPLAGETFSFLLLFGSAALVVRSLVGRRVPSELLRRLAVPLALWGLGSAFLLFLGFMDGGDVAPLASASTRFSHQLPFDNAIPLYYAAWFHEHGHAGDPPIYPGGWLSSDRPPLQVGYMLAQFPFTWGDDELHYQVLGVLLQQLWIVGLWALLLAAGVGRVTRALAMIAVLASGLAIVNGFFVWPKMLPAAMLLAAAALLMTPLWKQVRGSLWAAALLGALFGVAMMGHGSSVFGVIPLALVAAFRGLPSWRWIGAGLLVAVVLMGSWSAYQKYGDPPGDRVTKWMLAGDPRIDDRGTLEAIVDSYTEASPGEIAGNKLDNYLQMVGWGPVPAVDSAGRAIDAAADGDVEQTVRELRSMQFFTFLASLGLLIFAPFVILAVRLRRRVESPEWTFALTSLAVVVIGCVIWGLLIFGNSDADAVLHVGSYLLPMLAICGAVAGLLATAPRLAIVLVALNCVLTLGLYTPSFDPVPGAGFVFLEALLAVAGLAGFVLVALRAADT